MPSSHPTLKADFLRYIGLIEAALRPLPVFMAQAEDRDAIQVERGLIYAQALMDPHAAPVTMGPAPAVERLIEAAALGKAGELCVVDRNGHHRPVYRPLLVYAWGMAFGLVHETLPRQQVGLWEGGLRAWADGLEARLNTLSLPSGAAPAAAGATIAEACWIGLALHVAGRELARHAWTDMGADVLGRLPAWQRENGAFLTAAPSDNPETLAYHELAILHAAASYAVQTEHGALSTAVARSALFHQDQTQPDHATTQPWGLFAFAWDRHSRPMADAMLHAVTLQQPPPGSNVPGVSLMLLTDALYCMKMFD